LLNTSLGNSNFFLYKFSKLNFVMREHKEPYLFPSGLKAKAFIGPKCPFTPPISS